MLAKLSKDDRLRLRLHVGNCPAKCGPSSLPDISPIYRSSRRSVTFRCTTCGLQWTMSFHMIAKSLRSQAEAKGAHPVTTYTAALAEMIADLVGESRGRKRPPAADGRGTDDHGR